MKILGIMVGIVGAGLFMWHVIIVMMGTDIRTGYASHESLSLIGGLMMFAGIWIYIEGRRRAYTTHKNIDR